MVYGAYIRIPLEEAQAKVRTIPADRFFWMVGLFEGEAAFLYPNNSMRISINMTDKDTIDRLESFLPFTVSTRTKVRNDPKHKDCHYIEINGSRAIALMEVVYPYMSDRRRAKIAELLESYYAKERR